VLNPHENFRLLDRRTRTITPERINNRSAPLVRVSTAASKIGQRTSGHPLFARARDVRADGCYRRKPTWRKPGHIDAIDPNCDIGCEALVQRGTAKCWYPSLYLIVSGIRRCTGAGNAKIGLAHSTSGLRFE
jgi:hypothetical protein